MSTDVSLKRLARQIIGVDGSVRCTRVDYVRAPTDRQTVSRVVRTHSTRTSRRDAPVRLPFKTRE